MKECVSIAQSSFIKTRSIHNNFIFVRNYARWLHRRKKPSLLFKLDIKKAFDSARSHLDWVAALLSSSSSWVLLNGISDDPIKHGHDLRQGDPLSALPFDIAIDPLR
jgi:hypothetical protein